jgi:hypothetical protein
VIPTPKEVYGTLLHHRYRQHLNKIALDMKSPEFLQEGKLVQYDVQLTPDFMFLHSVRERERAHMIDIQNYLKEFPNAVGYKPLIYDNKDPNATFNFSTRGKK